MATLLLVILVPRLLPAAYIPLGLGLHKSMEMASSSLSQTLAGLWLDWTRKTADDEDDEYEAGEGLLRIFWIINILQLGCILLLWRFEGHRRRSHSFTLGDDRIERAEEYEQLPLSDVSDGPSSPLTEYASRRLSADDDDNDDIKPVLDPVPDSAPEVEPCSALASTEGERQRSRVYFYISLLFIAFVWIVFLGSAWSRL